MSGDGRWAMGDGRGVQGQRTARAAERVGSGRRGRDRLDASVCDMHELVRRVHSSVGTRRGAGLIVDMKRKPASKPRASVVAARDARVPTRVQPALLLLRESREGRSRG